MNGILQIVKSDFWALWLKFLSEESFVSSNYQEISNEPIPIEESGQDDPLTDGGFRTESEELSWIEKFHAKYAPSRKLKHLYFDEQVLVILARNKQLCRSYMSAYLAVRRKHIFE